MSGGGILSWRLRGTFSSCLSSGQRGWSRGLKVRRPGFVAAGEPLLVSRRGGRGGGKQFGVLEVGHTPHRPGKKTGLRGQGGARPGLPAPSAPPRLKMPPAPNQVQVLQPDGDPRGLHAHGGRGGLQRWGLGWGGGVREETALVSLRDSHRMLGSMVARAGGLEGGWIWVRIHSHFSLAVCP